MVKSLLNVTRSNRKMLKIGTMACCLGLFFAAQIRAQTDDDPATLHIGPGAGTACAQGCGGDPNLIGNGTTADIYQNSGGAGALSQPTFLILGVPNNQSVPSIGGPITFYNPYPGSPVTGSWAVASGGTTQWDMSTGTGGFFGEMSSGDVYNFLNLPGNNSNSFTNWANADLSINGIHASDFGIYVFALNGVELGGNGLINISGLSVPLGTFAVAWGCQTAGDHPCLGKNTFTTPFTEAGLTDGRHDATPEPASLFLLGSGLLAVGIFRRRWVAALLGR